MEKYQNQKLTGVSKSTISKALNHCYGVDGALRLQILNEHPENKLRKSYSNVGVYFILPQNPKFFWKCKMHRSYSKEVAYKYNIYSNLSDEEVILHYLNEAEELNAKVIVIVAPPKKKIIERIQELSSGRLIIHLNQLAIAKNTFFVGPDPQKEGQMLAEAVLKHHDKSKKLLIASCNQNSCYSQDKMRELAFIEALANKIPYENLLFESSTQNPFFAASISRTIAEKLEQSDIGSVVCFDGFTSKMCAALRKIKTNLRKDILGFGFEDDPQNKEYIELGILKAVVAQPFQDQLDYSIELAKNYIEKGAFPKNKYTYFPSVLKEY